MSLIYKKGSVDVAALEQREINLDLVYVKILANPFFSPYQVYNQ